MRNKYPFHAYYRFSERVYSPDLRGGGAKGSAFFLLIQWRKGEFVRQSLLCGKNVRRGTIISNVEWKGFLHMERLLGGE